MLIFSLFAVIVSSSLTGKVTKITIKNPNCREYRLEPLDPQRNIADLNPQKKEPTMVTLCKKNPK